MTANRKGEKVMTTAPKTMIRWEGLKARGIELSPATIYRLMSKGKFPQSVKQGEQKIAWIAEEIDSWIEARAANRGTPQAA